MEKACLFLDRESVGGVRWYVEGAEALLAAQQDDRPRDESTAEHTVQFTNTDSLALHTTAAQKAVILMLIVGFLLAGIFYAAKWRRRRMEVNRLDN